MRYISNFFRGIVGDAKSTDEFNKVLGNGSETAKYAAQTGYSVAKLAVQFGTTLGIFDYTAGKIVSTKAMGGFVPSFAAISIPVKVTNAMFNVLVHNPTTALAATIGASVFLYPENTIDLVKNTGYTLCGSVKTAYHGLKCAATSFTEGLEAVEDFCSSYSSSIVGDLNLHSDLIAA
jgi:hypothetical protein